MSAGILANGWRPIETAPKEIEVIVRCDTGLFVGVGVGFLFEEEWTNPAGAVIGPPTHWQPLPSANLKTSENQEPLVCPSCMSNAEFADMMLPPSASLEPAKATTDGFTRAELDVKYAEFQAKVAEDVAEIKGTNAAGPQVTEDETNLVFDIRKSATADTWQLSFTDACKLAADYRHAAVEAATKELREALMLCEAQLTPSRNDRDLIAADAARAALQAKGHS